MGARVTLARLACLSVLATTPLCGESLPVATRLEAPAGFIEGQVWALAHAPDGTRFIGSNRLAAFDGSRWSLIATPETYAFRALATAPGRVYIGSFNQVGYIEMLGDGSWHYTSLATEAVQAGVGALGEVWSAFALDHGAIWVTTDHVLRWNGQRMESWKLPAQPRLLGFRDGDAVAIYQSGVGLLTIGQTGPPTLRVPDSQLPGRPVTWNAGDLWGANEDAYRRSADGHFTRIEGLSAELAGTLPNSAARVNADTLAIGTSRGGLVLASNDGHVLAHWRGTHALGGKSINALAADGNGRLWVAMDNGLVRIDAPGESAFFDAKTDLDNDSALKVVAEPGGGVVMTAHGLYRVNAKVVAPLAEDRAKVWDIAHLGGEWWSAGFGGIWKGEERVHLVSADDFQIAPSRQVPDGLIFTEKGAVKALYPSVHGGWAAQDLVRAGIDDTPVSLLEDADDRVWVSTLLNGIYCFEWNPHGDEERPTLRLLGHYSSAHGLPSGVRRPVLVIAGGHLLAFADAAILVFEPEQHRFVPLAGAEAFRGVGVASRGAETYWLVKPIATGGDAAVVRAEIDGAGKFSWQAVDIPGLEKLGAATSLALGDDGALWVTGEHGILAVQASVLHRPAPKPFPLSLHAVGVEGTAEESVKNLAEPLDAASSARSLTFSFPASAAADGELVLYQTRLTNWEADWSAPSREATRAFTGLAAGEYLFEARTLDRFGRPGPGASMAFMIPRPWWSTPFARAAYVAGAVLLTIGALRWRLKRLEAQNARLNRLVAERTRELELSSTAKSEFLENISHEIRNPLSGLGGLLEMYQEDRLEMRERELTRSVKACAAHLTRVCEEVLGFSKLEYGYVKVKKEPFNLRSLLEEIKYLYSATAKQRGCAITVEYPAEAADRFVGDDAKVTSIVGNFVSNAIKYAPGKPIEIHVDVMAPLDTGMAPIFIEVTDHGPGIPEEEQGLIFQKFVRGSQAKTTGTTGTGLGLATCRMLAKAINGSIGLETELGRGSTFYLKLWLSPATEAEKIPETPLPAVELDGKSLALVVEDEPYNQTVLKGIAIALGYVPVVAGNAAEAFARMKAFGFDVIFLDWELPDIKGSEIARRVRTQKDGKDPIIVATTAHDSDEMRQRCLDAGMDEFLLKPYTQAQVRHAIERVRARRAGQPEPDAPAAGARHGLHLEAFTLYGLAEPALAGKAAAIYREALDHELSALNGAANRGDTQAVVQAAHRTQALAGLIGAVQPKDIAKRLEKEAPTMTREARTEALRELSTALEFLKTQLGGAG